MTLTALQEFVNKAVTEIRMKGGDPDKVIVATIVNPRTPTVWGLEAPVIVPSMHNTPIVALVGNVEGVNTIPGPKTTEILREELGWR